MLHTGGKREERGGQTQTPKDTGLTAKIGEARGLDRQMIMATMTGMETMAMIGHKMRTRIEAVMSWTISRLIMQGWRLEIQNLMPRG